MDYLEGDNASDILLSETCHLRENIAIIGIPSTLTELNRTFFEQVFAEYNCTCEEVVNLSGISNLFCEDSPYNHAWWVQLYYITMFALIIVVAVGGNFAVIWIVLAHKRMRTVTNYFLLNLAISDASISIFNVCFNFIINFYYDWFFSHDYCIFTNFMGVVPTCVSVFTLMAMSLDRYVAIMYPLRRRLSQKKTICIIVCIWIAACLCGLPMLLYSNTITFYFFDGTIQTLCRSDQYPDGDATSGSFQFAMYNNFLLAQTYILPLVVLAITYIRIGKELWGGATIGEHQHTENIRAKRKVVKMMFVVVAIFLICWLPYHVYFAILIRVLSDFPFTQHIYLHIYWLAMSSTIFNPIIYAWMNSKFRVGIKYAYRWLPCVHIKKEDYLMSDLIRGGARTPYAFTSEMTSNYSRVPTIRASPLSRDLRRERSSSTTNGTARSLVGVQCRNSIISTIDTRAPSPKFLSPGYVGNNGLDFSREEAIRRPLLGATAFDTSRKQSLGCVAFADQQEVVIPRCKRSVSESDQFDGGGGSFEKSQQDSAFVDDIDYADDDENSPTKVVDC